MALSTYDKNNLTGSQQAGIAAATKAWNDANARGDAAGMAAAHAQAESIRNNAGYTSNASGAYSGRLSSGSGGGSTRVVAGGGDAPTASSSYAIDARGNVTGTDAGGRNYAYVDQTVADRYRQEQQTLYEKQLAAEQLAAQQEYERQLAAQRAATEAAVQKAVNDLEGQKENVERQYADLFRQLYVDKMRSRKNLDQRLAAQGVTGGAAESTVLGYDSAYEDALRQGEQGRIAVRSELDRAITDTRLAGDAETAKAAAESAKALSEQYAASIKELAARREAEEARKEANAREDALRAERYEREDALRQEAYERENAAAARTAAQTLVQRYLSAGRMPPEELLRLAGMDAATAQGLLAIRAEEEEREQTQAEANKKPALTAAQVNAALKNGIRTDAVREAYEYYYGAPYRG